MKLDKLGNHKVYIYACDFPVYMFIIVYTFVGVLVYRGIRRYSFAFCNFLHLPQKVLSFLASLPLRFLKD